LLFSPVAVDALLRKHLWIIDLLAVGLCAIFLGRAAASAFESNVLLKQPLPRPALRPMSTQSEKVYSKDYTDVIKRNVFCSTCPPIVEQTEAAGPAAVDNTPQRTTLPLTLLAVNFVVPPWGFQHSSAVLRDNDTKFVGAFRAGEKVKGATITGIDETRIHFDNQGKVEYLDLLEIEGQPAPTPAPAAPTAAAAAAPGGDALSQELDRGIKKTGEHTYDITRSTLESVLGNMSLLSRSARIVPEIRDGKAAGFRLYSVRPEGPFAKIGMQNGDVISAINGLEITSPEKALEVYAKLKSASHLSVGLERNGQRITKDYSIR
jgi:general secretion pathway protein C